MNKFVCVKCGASSYSATTIKYLRIKTCEECGSAIKMIPLGEELESKLRPIKPQFNKE